MNGDFDLEQFADFIELIADAAVASDQEGNIVLANEEAVKQWGYSREQLLGMTVYDVTPQRRREQLQRERGEFFASSVRSVSGRHEHHWVLRADGTEYPVELSFSRLETTSGPIRVAAVRDISEKLQHQAEREELRLRLEHSQASRMEAVGQLAGGIAHDFNNLLGVIINYADFAISELEDRPAVREDIEQILTAANRAAELTHQLLVFSRRKDEPRRPVDLNEVLGSIEKLLRRALGEHIELVTDLSPELATVVVDPSQLEQAVINLAANARDAMPDGGVLEIATANVELGAGDLEGRSADLTPGPHVRLTVSDSGTGMDQETIDRAFEPFFTTKHPAGTGLGLATVYGTVKSHGGDIRLSSEPGRGTTVEIDLPASAAAPEPSSPSDLPAAASGQGERVLVVEDDESVRRMIVRALSEGGYNVVDRPGASEALELLDDPGESFALLVTDVVMPGLHGGELAQEARTLRPKLPVLFVSGYNELALRQTESGESADLLEKPFTANALLGAVRRVIVEGTE